MDSSPHTPQRLELRVAPGTAPLFATVLQAGVAIPAPAGETLGAFLDRLPDFSRDYIVGEIQTIFLNGTAIDDLQTPLAGDNPVLALSAAMPGLAGAIFRKNSFHAALRTTLAEKQTAHSERETVIVTLKLFNSIARDRGPALLAEGVAIDAGHLLNFFKTSPTLLSHLRHVDMSGQVRDRQELTGLLEQNSPVRLVVREARHG